jgi:branched-chain amino acid transport system ATP-binding protein
LSSLLQIRKLSFAYGDLRVLWDVDLDVRQGEVVTVVGANGAGKSTTLRNVSRLVRPDAGTIEFDGQDLRRLAPHDVVALGIVQVPEGRRIFPEMTVLENLRMGSYLPATRRDRARNLERVFALFPRLQERQRQLGGTMSGGEQQMLAIGRALMARPLLVMLDEPSMGLAPLVVKDILATVERIAAGGTTVLLVEQNARSALRVARRGYVLENGRVVLEGTSEELLQNRDVQRAYLGSEVMP